MACERSVVTYVSSEYLQYGDFPLDDINTVDGIVEAVKSASPKLWNAEYEYFCKRYNQGQVTDKISNIYVGLIGV